ncbi:hypothetical protein Bca4012_049583 [Brassica carinata]|uniref:Uncharacterized protein n=1 Tax=Brassica carinata TaxID=52824 RepID=A0A8X7R9P1_BRACI|nr:hypothetical protein Bca52824_052344 [Brassica carinata]
MTKTGRLLSPSRIEVPSTPPAYPTQTRLRDGTTTEADFASAEKETNPDDPSPEALVFELKYTFVLNVSLPWKVKASSSSSFSSPVLGDYRCSGGSRVVRRALSHLVFAHFPASLRYYEVFGKMFPGGLLSLRADSSGRPKLPGSDSRLNLARLLAARSRLT